MLFLWSRTNKIQKSVLKYACLAVALVWIILINIAKKTQSKVSPEMKLIHPLDFQLCVSGTIPVDASLPFAFQRQRVIALALSSI